MKHFLLIKPGQSCKSHLRLTAPVLWLCLLAGAAHAEPASPPAKPAAQDQSPALQEVVFLKSAFVDEPSGGKDPFFPKSRRREQRAPDVFQPTPLEILKNLFLKGISGTRDKRLALINNRTLEVGEEGEFKQGNLAIKIRVVEITDKSVFFTIEGSHDRKELRLRNGL
jgi:hypothetical protein